MKSTKAIVKRHENPKRGIPNTTFADGVEMITKKKRKKAQTYHRNAIFNNQAKALSKVRPSKFCSRCRIHDNQHQRILFRLNTKRVHRQYV